MRGFLTAILLGVLAGVLFANNASSSLLTDGPALPSQAMADANPDSNAAPVTLARWN